METLNSASLIGAAKRVVIKIGSALLVDAATGLLRADWLAGLADDIAMLKADGKEVLIVSSGSIALGRRVLGFPSDALSSAMYMSGIQHPPISQANRIRRSGIASRSFYPEGRHYRYLSFPC